MAALALVFALVAAGLWATGTLRPGGFSPAGSFVSRGDPQQFLPEYLRESWVWTGDDSGGFGLRTDLSEPLSLYRTAWMIHLGSLLGVTRQGLHVDLATSWLRTVVASGSDSRGEGLPGLENACLAEMALSDLGSGLSGTDAESALDRWRIGSMYTWDEGRTGDWSATARAIVMLFSQSAPIPPEIRDGTLSTIRSPAFDPMLGGDGDKMSSFWQVADIVLTPSERAPYHQALLEDLESVGRAALGRGGTALGTLVALRSIAQANGIPVQIDPPALTNLVAPDGLLRLTPTDLASDPQATFYALTLGWKPSARTWATVSESSGSEGWPKPILTVSPEASYFGSMLAHTLGDTEWDAPQRVQEASWLANFQGQDHRQQYFEIALAHELGISIPQNVVDAVRNGDHLSRSGDAAPDYVAIAGLLGVSIDSTTGPFATATYGSVAEAYAAWLWGAAARSAGTCSGAARAVAGLRTPSGAVRGSYNSDVDLFSTAVDHRLNQLGPHASLIAQFANGSGYWHYPPGRPNNHVDLQSFYLAAYVSGQIKSPEGIF